MGGSMNGVEVQEHSVENWLNKLSKGEIVLPEFQRDFVWDRHRICDFVRAILRNQPVGCLLILPIHEDREQRLRHRSVQGIEHKQSKEYESLLLDGQQRLTALWQVVQDSASVQKYRYYIKLDLDERDSLGPIIESHSASLNWTEDPGKCFSKDLIPLSLLWGRSKFERSMVYEKDPVQLWFRTALGAEKFKPDSFFKLNNWISARSEEFRNYRIPSLVLDKKTTKMEAINTFIETNTSSQKLRKFDIIVGEFLSHQEGHLRDLREEVNREVEYIDDYMNISDVGDLLLKIACLCVNLVPTEKHYSDPKVLEYLNLHFDRIAEGIRWTVELLQAENIFDKQRLPSTIPFRVLPALHQKLKPKDLDFPLANKVARAYLWRTFATERYVRSANMLLKEDLDKLSLVFTAPEQPRLKDVPIWDEAKYQLPSERLLIEQAWPTGQGMLKRAVLAVYLRSGAKDINTNQKISNKNIKLREYHHIFPKRYLEENRIDDREANIALNCVLIKARTNRKIASNPPLTYFRKLYEFSNSDVEITENDIKVMLRSHVLPESMLNVPNHSNIKKLYKDFINARAKLVRSHIQQLANGDDPQDG